MCTVTYIPHHNNQFILTSNRDEAPERQTVFPAQDNASLIFPKDKTAGGTWIATNGKLTACLLNGAFDKHHRTPPYRMSRGKVVMATFTFSSAYAFIEDFDFSGIEPFTLILVEHNPRKLFELRWDGEHLHFREPEVDRAHIWSSATLYPTEIAMQREQWFVDWQTQKNWALQDIRLFHHQAGIGDAHNDLVMDRGFVKTVSITSVFHNEEETQMHYKELLDGIERMEKINHGNVFQNIP